MDFVVSCVQKIYRFSTVNLHEPCQREGLNGHFNNKLTIRFISVPTLWPNCLRKLCLDIMYKTKVRLGELAGSRNLFTVFYLISVPKDDSQNSTDTWLTAWSCLRAHRLSTRRRARRNRCWPAWTSSSSSSRSPSGGTPTTTGGWSFQQGAHEKTISLYLRSNIIKKGVLEISDLRSEV